MAKNVTARLQFSLGELLGTVVMTFLGMTLWLPNHPQFWDIFFVVFSTWTAALLAVNCHAEPRVRLCLLPACIALTWILFASLGWLYGRRQDAFLIWTFILIPILIGIVSGYVTAQRVRDPRGNVSYGCVVKRVALFMVLYYVNGIVLAATSLLPERMHGCPIAAAAACKAFAEGEEIYHRTDYNNDGVLEYAQHMKGSESLLMNGTTEIALIDRAFAAAEGPSIYATPKAGYLYRILRAQGKHAPGGPMSYIENGRMTKGYALIAYPAAYDITGRDCYMINQAGTIYQADLGAKTTQIVWEIQAFDPDPEIWFPTE